MGTPIEDERDAWRRVADDESRTENQRRHARRIAARYAELAASPFPLGRL